MNSRYFVLLFCLLSLSAAAQKTTAKRGIGVIAGLNLPSVKVPASFRASGNTGFVVGGFISPPAQGFFGFRSELLFSRQGYDYETSRQTGTVKLDYIVLPQFTSFNLTKFLRLHVGGQMAILVKGKVDSSANPSSVPGTVKGENYFNKLNYGVAGGVELQPLAGMIIGARYNLFFRPANKLTGNSVSPDYLPKENDLKTGLLQIYLGYVF